MVIYVGVGLVVGLHRIIHVVVGVCLFVSVFFGSKFLLVWYGYRCCC